MKINFSLSDWIIKLLELLKIRFLNKIGEKKKKQSVKNKNVKNKYEKKGKMFVQPLTSSYCSQNTSKTF